MTNRERYEIFCKTQPHLPLYLRPLWLNLVSDQWDVLLTEEKGTIIGAMPYEITRSHGITQLRNFTHTKYCGVVVAQSNSVKPYKQYSMNKKVLTQLAEQIDTLPIDYFCASFSLQIQNWSPFYHRGFCQQTLYTYRIPYREKFEETWGNMHTHVRNTAKNKFGLIIKRDVYGAKVLQAQISGSFVKQGKTTGLTVPFLDGIYKGLQENSCATILTAEDETGKIHGAICFVWDDDTLYYEFAGEDPELRSSNSLTLLILEGIRMAHEKGLAFDFDIGMAENFTDFAATFGAVPVPYYEISKITSQNRIKKLALTTYFTYLKK